MRKRHYFSPPPGAEESTEVTLSAHGCGLATDVLHFVFIQMVDTPLLGVHIEVEPTLHECLELLDELEDGLIQTVLGNHPWCHADFHAQPTCNGHWHGNNLTLPGEPLLQVHDGSVEIFLFES